MTIVGIDRRHNIAGELSSLDVASTLESGYYSLVAISREGSRARLRTCYRLSNVGIIPLIQWYIEAPKERLLLRSFPYVDEDRLRIWDVDEGEPIRLLGRGVVDGAFPAEEVRKRCPKLFAWAQQLGYWNHVSV